MEAELQGKPHPECQAIKEAMLAGIRGLALPGNFLDELVDQLGGAAKVAEMTGRKCANSCSQFAPCIGPTAVI